MRKVNFYVVLKVVALTAQISHTRRVAELREGLVEEGRRRRLHYEERKWAAQSELRRVRAEETAVGEKDGMLRLLLKVSVRQTVTPRRQVDADKTYSR